MSDEKKELTADEVFFSKEYLEKQKQQKRKEALKLTDEELASCFDGQSTWKKVTDWWKGLPVKPYVRMTDMSDPSGSRKDDPFDDGSGGKHAGEIGISFSF